MVDSVVVVMWNKGLKIFPDDWPDDWLFDNHNRLNDFNRRFRSWLDDFPNDFPDTCPNGFPNGFPNDFPNDWLFDRNNNTSFIL